MEIKQPKTENENKAFESRPIVETKLGVSKDGKYVIHKTVITDIKPVKYWEKVVEGKGE